MTAIETCIRITMPPTRRNSHRTVLAGVRWSSLSREAGYRILHDSTGNWRGHSGGAWTALTEHQLRTRAEVDPLTHADGAFFLAVRSCLIALGMPDTGDSGAQSPRRLTLTYPTYQTYTYPVANWSVITTNSSHTN